MLRFPEFCVRFFEDVEIMNDVRSDIQADKMKFNAIIQSTGIKETFKHINLKNSNMDNWRKGLYNNYRKQTSEIIFEENDKNKKKI